MLGPMASLMDPCAVQWPASSCAICSIVMRRSREFGTITRRKIAAKGSGSPFAYLSAATARSEDASASAMRQGASNAPKIRSTQNCYPCLRYKPLPMCPEWTEIAWWAHQDSNLGPSDYETRAARDENQRTPTTPNFLRDFRIWRLG